MNQCWLIVSEVLWRLLEASIVENVNGVNHENIFGYYMSKASHKKRRNFIVNARELRPCIDIKFDTSQRPINQQIDSFVQPFLPWTWND